MRQRHQPSCNENQNDARQPRPPQQFNHTDKDASLEERRKHKPLNDVSRRITMGLPKRERTGRKMKEPNNGPKQLSQSVAVTCHDKNEDKR